MKISNTSSCNVHRDITTQPMA